LDWKRLGARLSIHFVATVRHFVDNKTRSILTSCDYDVPSDLYSVESDGKMIMNRD